MYCVDPCNKIKHFGDSSESKILSHDENTSLNSNKTDISMDFKNLNLSHSFSDKNSLESSILDEQNTSRRIIYTKEFLLNLRMREASRTFPDNLLPKQEGLENIYWDPEKYFDCIKGSDSNIKNLHQKKLAQSKQIDLNQINYCFHFGLFRNKNPLDSGEQLDVYLCEPFFTNDIYVNLDCLKGSLQQFSSIINVYCNNQLTNFLELESLKKENVFFAFNINVWHRVKYLSNVQNEPEYLNVLCIDNGKKFKSNIFLPCPREFSDIPPFGIRVSLAGCPKEFHLPLVSNFTKNLNNFKMKILFYNKQKSKYYVELFNDQRISLNHVINPKFLKELFLHADD
ncbi:hypothetical protein BpHYR1_014693 [Brachionus plicatilis]|uniref:Tudor domain-containing protein n=1 Tax=Brachionus plicatilis TaxID=10195 RepID=A0A3M7RI13_BRAPC|nr:hypothetical protein BpHYR1_014693 [Brachionus plicatilis]